jgi:adenosylmethionine-8-amino-7-oxononanoate aminotransferase
VTHVFHRDPRNRYPLAVQGDGAYLIDAQGKRYLDASGGAAVSCLGHSDRAVIEAIQRQLDVLPYAHTSFFSNQPMERLADVLVEHSAGAFDKVYFVSGGSEAIEAALSAATSLRAGSRTMATPWVRLRSAATRRGAGNSSRC